MTLGLRSLAQAARRLDAAVRRVEAAGHPGQISARGWRELIWTALRCTLRHRAPSTAAAATYYGFLAFVPTVAAFGCVYGLLSSPERLRHRLDSFSDLAPAGVLHVVQGQALRFASGPREHLAGAAVGFLVVALFGATSALRALLHGLNTAYGVQETRPWWKGRLLCLVFAAGVGALGSAVLWLVLKSVDATEGEVGAVAAAVLVLRWALVFLGFMAALAVLYRYGPDRPRSRWRWVTPGSALAAGAGLLTSAGVTLYLAHFADYERTYGGLGSVLGLMTWLWMLLTVVLAGAELNRAMEDKTSHDTAVTGRATS